MTITVSLSKPEVKWGMLSSRLEPDLWTVHYWLKFTIAGAGEAQSPAMIAVVAAETVEEARERANHYQQGIQTFVEGLDLPEALTAFKGLVDDISVEEDERLRLKGLPPIDKS